MCMDKSNEVGETFVYFSRMKRYLRLSKNLQFCELRYPICIICIRRGTHIAIEANVRTIIVLYNEPYKNFTRSCLHRKKTSSC